MASRYPSVFDGVGKRSERVQGGRCEWQKSPTPEPPFVKQEFVTGRKKSPSPRRRDRAGEYDVLETPLPGAGESQDALG